MELDRELSCKVHMDMAYAHWVSEERGWGKKIWEEEWECEKRKNEMYERAQEHWLLHHDPGEEERKDKSAGQAAVREFNHDPMPGRKIGESKKPGPGTHKDVVHYKQMVFQLATILEEVLGANEERGQEKGERLARAHGQGATKVDRLMG